MLPDNLGLPQVYVYQPKGRLFSATNAPELLYWLTSLLDANVRTLAVDLKDVSFMDSSGLGALVIANTRVQRLEGTFALCALGGQARMLIEMSGMDQVFQVYPSVAEFKQAIATQQG